MVEAGSGMALTPDAQKMVERLPKKGEAAERLFLIKDRLSDYNVKGEHAAICSLPRSSSGQPCWRIARPPPAPARTCWCPKPKPAEAIKRPGQRQRKPAPARRRKD